MLNALILGQDETPEITFELQVAGDESVPDAIISQKSFKIVVETKLHNQFQQDQLEKHLTQFGTEEIKVLLTLDPKPMKESLMDSFGIVLKKYNADRINEIKTLIRHVNITFEHFCQIKIFTFLNRIFTCFFKVCWIKMLNYKISMFDGF